MFTFLLTLFNFLLLIAILILVALMYTGKSVHIPPSSISESFCTCSGAQYNGSEGNESVIPCSPNKPDSRYGGCSYSQDSFERAQEYNEGLFKPQFDGV